MSERVSLSEQVSCLQRELRLRRRNYPRWVADGRMTAAESAKQIAHMEAALATLERLAADAAPDLFGGARHE
jgi:hypothetical protein